MQIIMKTKGHKLYSQTARAINVANFHIKFFSFLCVTVKNPQDKSVQKLENLNNHHLKKHRFSKLIIIGILLICYHILFTVPNPSATLSSQPLDNLIITMPLVGKRPLIKRFTNFNILQDIITNNRRLYNHSVETLVITHKNL